MAHHSLAATYDIRKESQLTGIVTKVAFTNPHGALSLEVKNPDGTKTEWVLTTASLQVLTRAGVNSQSIKPGEILKITALPARNGNPAGFIRRLELGDKQFNLIVD
jgi:DNA/RNA endonuclease YhcR with UshA esterase domain